jgi:bifunctional non-homologous end joining protein LigD
MDENKHDAPGLPSRTRFDPINQKGTTRLVVQKHKAKTEHYDIRLKDKGIAHSWVTRSLPGEKQKTLAIRQPTHLSSYMDFEGKIKKGYGAGTVKKVYDEKIKVISATNDKIKMKLPEGYFTMIRPKGADDKHWLMIKTSVIKNPVTSKPKYQTVKKSLDFSDENKVLQPKVDGSHSIFQLNANKENDIYSYRTSKKTGKPIEHTNQVPHLRDLKVPESLSGTVLRGDLYGTTSKGPLPAEQISGILNSNVDKSLEKQKQTAPLKPYIFDIVKFKGKDVSSAPYADKLKMMKQVELKIPAMRVAETVITQKDKQDLLNKIQKQKHPDTVEGVVEWDLNKPGGSPRKQKFRDTHDVYIRNIYPQVKKNEAGGFQYSLTPKGKIVGNVGTGFTQEKRKDMLAHPENYVGMVARVKSPQQYSSGALRAPAFYTMDVEKNLEKVSTFYGLLTKMFIN